MESRGLGEGFACEELSFLAFDRAPCRGHDRLPLLRYLLPDFSWQVGQAEGAVILLIGQRPPHEVLELPRIAWVIDLRERLLKLRARPYSPPQLKRLMLHEEVLDERTDVLGPFAKRRDAYWRNI